MKKKFKVGDKVRLKENLVAGNKYGRITFISNMNRFKGEIGIINVVKFNSYTVVFNNDPFQFIYDGAMLEPAYETIVIYRDGRKVVALDKYTKKKAIARCHPDDEFDFSVGAKIAMSRLLGEVENNNIVREGDSVYIKLNVDDLKRVLS